MGKHNLNHEQRLKLYAWAAEGIRLWEVNQRAAKCDPPFTVSWAQLKWARKVCGVRALEVRKKQYAEAYAEGEARR